MIPAPINLLTISSLLAFSAPATATPTTPPNVIIVITDDQGKGDLGCYGNKIIKTPNLDRFYTESVRLDNFHVSTTCAPTRSALLTGKNCNRLNVYHTVAGRSILFEEETVMPEVFASNGYSTGMFGKWHLGDNYPYRPEDRGFGTVVRHGGGGITQAPDYWGNDYFNDVYLSYQAGNGHTTEKRFNGYCTDVFFDEAIRFIEDNQNKPFFCYIAANAPHTPLNVPAGYLDQYQKETEITEAQKRFYAMITNIDDNFKKLEDKLHQLKLHENTIVIFMTDNGTATGRVQVVNGKEFGFSAGLRGAKGSHYEGGHRVPFMIRWPVAGWTTGRDVPQLTAHIDVFPTLIDLAGLRAPSHLKFEGNTLTPLLKAQNITWPNRTLFVDTQRMTNLIKYRNYCVMDSLYRLIDGKELYNIRDDLGQTNNLYDQHPDVTARLQQAYENWWASLHADDLNSRYSFIRVGSPHENPTRISSHDLMSGEISQMWHQNGAINAVRSMGVYKIEVEESGKYLISLRRFPVESGLGFNDTFAKTAAKREIDGQIPASNNVNFIGAYFNFAGIEKKLEIKPADKEIRIEADLVSGKYDLEVRLLDEDGRAYPAYYVYFEKAGERLEK